MNIFHYRQTDYSGDPWKDGLITGETQLDNFKSKAIVTVNGQTIIKQHASTYLTGRDTCLAHHFAKMLAAAVLKGNYEHAPGLSVSVPDPGKGSVLWIDTVRGLHSCAEFFNEMMTKFDPGQQRFALLCLDKLGNFRYDFYALLDYIEKAIQHTKPSLIVIDDIDHLMPYSGVNVADAFNHAIRDTLNHTDTACLFIGYNHLGKRKSTTGNLGNLLFTAADNIFSITTQQAISRVKLVRSYCIESKHDAEFLFVVDDDNLPHEVIKAMADPDTSTFIKKNTLQDIIGEVIQPGQTISPDELYQQLNHRRQQFNRQDRIRTLIAQATQLGVIKKADDSNNYTLVPGTPKGCVPQDIPESCASSTSQPTGVNNSLTLPPLPSANKLSSITGCQPVKKSLHPANGPSSITGCQPVKKATPPLQSPVP